MAKNSININTTDVERLSQSIRNSNTRLNSIIASITREIQALKNEWDSPTGDALVQKYNELLPIFRSYKEKVESFSKFLDIAVDTYEKAELDIKSNAEQFM